MAKRTDEGAKGSAFLGLIMVKGVGPFCICLTVYEWLRVPRSGCFRAGAETGAAARQIRRAPARFHAGKIVDCACPNGMAVFV